MASINKQISRFETTAVYSHPDAKVDIVLVHGLNGEPQKTWTAKNGVFWPTDLLPESLKSARANVLVYGYNADVYSKKHGGNPSDNFIYMHAQTLVTSLTHYRKDELSSRNPIIWVCHSLGGILVKRALLYSNDLRASQHEDYRQIYVSTYGLIFLGTPHTGSDMGAWATMLQAMSDAVVPKAFWQSEPVLLKTLKKDNETLQNINNHFLDIYQRFQILMAHENHKTDLKGTRMLVVDAQSASPQLPGVAFFAIEQNHSNMCKFESKNAPGYRVVSTAIRDWVGQAPDTIMTRWRVEDDEKLARAKHEIEERMKPWLKSTQEAQQAQQGEIQDPNNQINSLTDPQKPPSRLDDISKPLLPEPQSPEAETELSSQDSVPDHKPSSREPIFVKPNVFRPNTHFKGRDQEMKALHKKLMDRERRSAGTSSVLIQSMPGGGKTHLARQYVFEYKYHYPGGIFWMRSKSIQELEYGYWDIAKTAALKEIDHLQKDGLNDTKKMVKAVRAWLSRTEGWLLVLDGVHFDLPELENFIPFANNTSIIYTSTERTTGEDYRFDNPQVIVLDPLTPREAQELLLEEMEKKKPWNQDDLSRALELVQLMDRLPLMIHVAARHLKATREPLSKYLRSYRSRPKAGHLPAYRAVREQLQHRGAVAALNLMSMLAFFSQHIPVEMLALGLQALDKRTPVKSYDIETRRATLNNTFKVLIAFALIERNENTATPSASDRSAHSVDMAQDSLDILRIHGIVQAFFVDTLADEKQAPFWLERAICVFCTAFDASDRRIREDAATGMPEDYMRFLIHGKKLLTYLDRFEKKAPELGECRDLLESRLDSTQARIDQLSKRKHNGDRSGGDVAIMSVFERTNSLSELDSGSPPSNSSLIDWQLDDDHPTLDSPAVYSPTDYNPYHWHVTYPYGVLGFDDGTTPRTVTPQPAPTEIFESISIPEDYDGLIASGHRHRTIKRNAERRYRDHAGAWRASPQILSDPRVSLSRETVKGFISPPNAQNQRGGRSRSSSSNRLTASSDAELTLNKITKISPPPQRGGGHITDKNSASSTSSVRPKLIAGRPSYTGTAQTEAAIEDDYPVTPTFINVMGTYPPPSSTYAAATIMRLKENEKAIATDGLSPVKVSSPLNTAVTTDLPPTTSPSASQRGAPDDGGLGYMSRPPLHPPSQTARSSPGQYTSPFQPAPIPIQVNMTSKWHTSVAHGMHHWDAYSQDLLSHDEGFNHLTHSQPYSPPSPPYPYTVPLCPEPFAIAIHPPPWTSSSTRLEQHPTGYSSQPMSRDPSHQSSQSHGSVQYGRRNGSPLAQDSGSSVLQTMQRPRSRRPSLVETEPSPRLGGFEVDTPPTSYDMYKDRGRRRTGSGFFSRFSRRGKSTASASSRVCHRRAESAGERLNRGQPGSSSTGSPDLRGAGERFSVGAEDTVRYASGGIKLADGTVVEFGQTPPSADGWNHASGGTGIGLGIID